MSSLHTFLQTSGLLPILARWQSLIGGLLGLLAGLVAFSGALIAAYWQVAVLKRQIAEDKNRAREVERAYVSGGGWRLVDRKLVESDDPDLGDLYEQSVRTVARGDETVLSIPSSRFELHINNHGKTPARLHHVAVGFCDAQALPPEPVYEDLFPFSDAIGPGDQSRIITTVTIPEGRTAICGRYYWDDIWGRHWSSGFVYEFPTSEHHRGRLAADQRGLNSISIEAPAAYWKDRPNDLPRAG